MFAEQTDRKGGVCTHEALKVNVLNYGPVKSVFFEILFLPFSFIGIPFLFIYF